MNRKLAIAAGIGLVLATSACSELSGMRGSADEERSYMGGSAPVSADPIGSANFGTGSVGATGEDNRVVFSSGIGLD